MRPLLIKVLILSSFFLAFYPIANSGRLGGGSDCDEAQIAGTLLLFSGENPYDFRTQFGNRISPLPGALLLSFPMLQASNIFWLALCPWIVLLNPRIWHCLAIGSDYPANTIYCLLVILWFIKKRDTLSGICLGIAMASRPNFWFWLPWAWGKKFWIPVFVCAVLVLPAILQANDTGKKIPLAGVIGGALILPFCMMLPRLLGMAAIQAWFVACSPATIYSVFFWVPLAFWIRENWGWLRDQGRENSGGSSLVVGQPSI